MAPKKEAAPAAAAAPGMSPEEQALKVQLIEECKAAKQLVMAEQASHNQLKEEKEKLSYLWALAKKDLEDKRGEVRALDRAQQDLGEELATEIAVHKNRIKQLLLGQQTAVTRERIDATTGLKLSEEGHIASERELKADKRDLAGLLKDMETGHEELVRSLKLDNDRAITELRLNFERESRELAAVYEDKLTRLREELARSREDDIRTIERRKTKHIQSLIAAHEKAFSDMKLYFNEITHSNLDLIKSLKEEVGELKKKEASDERVMYAIAQENKRMSEPMRKALEEVRRLREAREVYRREIQELHETKAHSLVTQDGLENLRWEHEILEQRYQRLVGERDALFNKFSAAIHEVKQKAGFRSVLLEHKLAAASEQVHREELALAEVLTAANLRPQDVGSVQKRLSEVMGEKDAVIAQLQGELATAAARHEQAVSYYTAVMAQQGVPPEELGFTPATARDLLKGV